MNRQIFIERYKKLNVEANIIDEYIETIISFEKYVALDIKDTSIEDLKTYISHLVATNQNNYNNFIHIARYYYYIDYKKHYIHMTRYFNSHGVLENIINRIGIYESEESKETFIKDMILPPLGTETSELPDYTNDFVNKLHSYFTQESCNKILAGNNHNIPEATFDKEKEYYNNSESLKEYLEERHQRKVKELTEYYDNNQVWFEQVITKEGIDYVKGNQEILSGVLKDDKLYITKIPHDINNFLDSEDDKLKRYYACHCSFVRENILDDNLNISKEWCNCSGGFAKYPFEVILNQELNVKLLETPLDGDQICRFEIDLSNIQYKK